nr:MAG TPA: hypothetical protein [Caudoviricetes sp.]
MGNSFCVLTLKFLCGIISPSVNKQLKQERRFLQWQKLP